MDVLKLAKVLALAASDNDAEAVHALRTARRLLDAHGVDFVELARRMAEDGPSRAEADALEDAVFDLRNEIRHLRAENERLRQGRGGAPAGTAEPASFQEASRDAAAAIRLRAELAALTDALELERNQVLRLKAHEATLHQSFQEALAEAGALAARLNDAEARRMRLEAENRRLLHANHALTVELEEAKTGAVPAAVAPMTPAPVVAEARREPAPRQLKPSARARAKGGVSQYALF